MMPGVGFEEMILLVLVAIVVIGPKDLPLMMRKFGRFTGRMRAMAFEFKQGFEELGRQAELEELRKEVADLKKHTGLEDLKREFEEDRRALESDVTSALADSNPKPAQLGTPAAGAEPPKPLPYAGLSPEHPGYNVGDDFRLEGHGPEPTPAAAPDAATPETATDTDENGVHVVPDDHVRPAHPAAARAPVKQDTPA